MIDDIPDGYFSKFITPNKSRNHRDNSSNLNNISHASYISSTPKLEKQRKLIPSYLLQRSFMETEDKRAAHTRNKYKKVIVYQKEDKYITAHFGFNNGQGDRNNSSTVDSKDLETLDGNYLLYFLLCPRILKISINKCPFYEFMFKLVISDSLFTKYVEHYTLQWMELVSLQPVYE